MNVILSIKPIYVDRIFDGSKRYEFRRLLFKNQRVNKVIIYATSPVKMIVGEFDIETIIINDIDALWEETNVYSGITKELFIKYFSDKKTGYAIKIKSFKKYDQPVCIKKVYKKNPPQSFVYA